MSRNVYDRDQDFGGFHATNVADASTSQGVPAFHQIGDAVTAGIAAITWETMPPFVPAGMVPFAGTDGALIVASTWISLFTDDVNHRIGVGTRFPTRTFEVGNGENWQIRIGNGTHYFDIGRGNGDGGLFTDGYLRFYGDNASHDGYVFTGVGGDKLTIAPTGAISMNGLAAGGFVSAAATTGLLSVSATIPAGSVTILDTAGYFTATTVEGAIAELYANPVFGEDTTLFAPNSAMPPTLVKELELVATLSTSTAGSEASRWGIKLLLAGSQVTAQDIRGNQTIFPDTGATVPSVALGAGNIGLGSDAANFRINFYVNGRTPSLAANAIFLDPGSAATGGFFADTGGANGGLYTAAGSGSFALKGGGVTGWTIDATGVYGNTLTAGGVVHATASTGFLAVSTIATADIAAGAVTLAKMANLAATRLLGNDTGTGAPVALTVTGGVEFTGSGGIQRSAITGDVAVPAGSGTATLASSGVTAATYGDASHVTQATFDVKGRATTASSVAIAIDTAALTSGFLAAARFPALTGDITTSAGAVATTIASHAVSNAKFRQGAATSVVGVTGGSTADVADIAAASDGQFLSRHSGAVAFAAIVAGDLPTAGAGRVLLGAASGGGYTSDSTIVGDTANHRLGVATATPNWTLDVNGATRLGGATGINADPDAAADIYFLALPASNVDKVLFSVGGGTHNATPDNTYFGIETANPTIASAQTLGVFSTFRIGSITMGVSGSGVGTFTHAASLYIDGPLTMPPLGGGTGYGGGDNWSIYVASGQTHLPGLNVQANISAGGVIEAGSTGSLFAYSMQAGVDTLAFFGATAITQQLGGSATAGGSYTSTEQGMINRMYGALRAFGLLS